MATDRGQWPAMVRLGLWGVPNRNAAWAFAAGSLILAIACIGLGFKDPKYFGGIAFLFAALWYYLAIRWVDQHNQWS